MKLKLLVCLTAFSFCGLSQINWHLTDIGLPTGYNPIHMTEAASGDVYTICERQQTAGTFPKLIKSSDKGTHWSEVVMTNMPTMRPTWILSASGKLYVTGFVGPGAPLYQSSDNGSSWTQVTTGFANTHMFRCMAYDAPNNTIYLGGVKNTSPNQQPFLAKSTDGGGSWAEITTSGITMSAKSIMALGFTNGKLLIAAHDQMGSYSYVYVSGDGGQTCTMINGLGPSPITKDFAWKTNGEMFLLAEYLNQTHIYNSTDNGINWDPVFISGLSAMTKPSGLLQTSGPMLACGAGASTFTYQIYSSEPPAGMVEHRYSGIAIYPNPAHEKIHIQFDDQNKLNEIISVDIISLDGRIIQHFDKDPGTIDISNLDPSVYELKIKGSDSYNISSRFVKH